MKCEEPMYGYVGRQDSRSSHVTASAAKTSERSVGCVGWLFDIAGTLKNKEPPDPDQINKLFDLAAEVSLEELETLEQQAIPQQSGCGDRIGQVTVSGPVPQVRRPKDTDSE
jgi:hypothetical protein